MAGRSFPRVRSPDAPKITKTHGSALRLDMTAELRAQRRQELFAEGVIAARAKARVERRRQHIGGDFLLDGRIDRPASFTRVRNLSDERLELRIARQRQRGEVQQPRAEDRKSTRLNSSHRCI